MNVPIIKCENCHKEEQKRRKTRFCSKGCATSFRQKINDPNYFDTNDKEFASYLTGLLFGDGCISQQEGKDERITLSLKDKDIIERIHPHFSPDRKIYVNKARCENHSDAYCLINTNIESLTLLKKMGLTPRKSLTLKYPQFDLINERDFIRGYFDANGSVFKNIVSGHIYHHVSITIGSYDFAFDLNSKLLSLGFDSKLNKDSRENHNAYYVKIYKKDHVLNFKNWMYNESEWFLPRKKDSFPSDIV